MVGIEVGGDRARGNRDALQRAAASSPSMTPGETPAAAASPDFDQASPSAAVSSTRFRAAVMRSGGAPARRTPIDRLLRLERLRRAEHHPEAPCRAGSACSPPPSRRSGSARREAAARRRSPRSRGASSAPPRRAPRSRPRRSRAACRAAPRRSCRARDRGPRRRCRAVDRHRHEHGEEMRCHRKCPCDRGPLPLVGGGRRRAGWAGASGLGRNDIG